MAPRTRDASPLRLACRTASISIPNCRVIDGETVYGARMVNFRQPELGLLVKDVAFYRKYLSEKIAEVQAGLTALGIRGRSNIL